jgi:hypothetical protein
MPYNPYFSSQYYNPYYNQRPPENYQRPSILQGKIVDNVEVVKAIDIPLDGSISYFPMADGTAIISKQLQQDGTSKLTIFRPVSEKEETQNKYITENDLKAYFGDYNQKDIKDIKEELKSLKKQIRNIENDIEDKKGD